MKFEIYDDFLSDYQANIIENALIAQDFHWYFHNDLNGGKWTRKLLYG
jgi:hypothetical protein